MPNALSVADTCERGEKCPAIRAHVAHELRLARRDSTNGRRVMAGARRQKPLDAVKFQTIDRISGLFG